MSGQDLISQEHHSQDAQTADEYHGTIRSPDRVYAATPLKTSSRTIRLLDLDSNPSDTYDSPLVASIRVVDLEDSPKFNALSYVWGSSGAGYHISCFATSSISAEIPISANCDGALRHIRKLFGRQTIWVDAICIHQINDDEREHQITFMEEIYSWAGTVYVWLGHGTAETNKGMEYLKLRARSSAAISLNLSAFSERSNGQSEREGAVRKAKRERAYRMRHMLNFAHVGWSSFLANPWSQSRYRDGVLALLDNKWLHRAWTFQEILLANNPLVICGEQTMPWEDLVRALADSAESNMQVLHVSRVSRIATLVPGRHFLAKKLGLVALEKIVVRHTNQGIDPKAQVLLDKWRSLIQLWLNLSRPSDWNRRKMTQVVFSEQKQYQPEEHLKFNFQEDVLVPSRITRFGFRLALFLPLLCVAAYLSYLVAISLQNTREIGLGNYTTTNEKVTTVAIWFFVIIGWIYALLLLTAIMSLLLTTPLSFIYSIIFGIHRHQIYQENMDELIGIITALRDRQASRAHDNVFALFGVLRTLGVTPTFPDYSRSLYKTEQLFFNDLLKWRKRALFLLCQSGIHSNPEGPSWLPNFTTKPPQSWLTERYALGDLRSATTLDPTNSFAMYPNENLLVVRGRVMGTITFCTRMEQTKSSGDIDFLQSLKAIHYWIAKIDRAARAGTAGDFIELLAFANIRGLVIPNVKMMTEWAIHPERRLRATSDGEGPIVGPENLAEASSNLMSTILQQLEGEFNDFLRFLDIYAQIVNYTPLLESEAAQEAPASAFQSLADQICRETEDYHLLSKMLRAVADDQRGLFIFDDDKAGTGHLDVAVGDIVVLVEGVPTPMVIRQLSNDQWQSRYAVVGAALVHGSMYGETYSRHELQTLRLI